eukprot:COSAG02_NODE_8196_length_2665_cov_20.682775_3_plen_99_part_00
MQLLAATTVLLVSFGATLVTAQSCSGTEYISLSSSQTYSFYDDDDNTIRYQNNADCKWRVRCPTGYYATVDLGAIDTERGYDISAFTKAASTSTAASA